MKEQIKLPAHDYQATGKVVIQYIDPVTDKVKEKIEGNNHIYTDQFFGTNWEGVLTNSILAITEGKTEPDPILPYMQGRIIGYGIPNQQTSSGQRGRYLPSESYIQRFLFGTVASKFTYEFTPTQAVGELGQIGLTRQFDYITENSGHESLPYKTIYTTGGYIPSSGLFVGTKNYTTTSTNVRIRDNFLDGFEMNGEYLIDISSIIDFDGKYTSYWNIAYDSVNEKIYIITKDTDLTSGSMYIHEFNDDTFSSVNQIYVLPYNVILPSIGEMNVSTVNAIALYDSKFFIMSETSEQILVIDLSTMNIIKVIDLTDKMTPEGINSYRLATRATSYFADGKYLYIDTSTQNRSHFALDMQNYNIYITGNNNSTRRIKHPYQIGAVQFRTDTTSRQTSRYYTAYAIYKVPSDAPTRPEGYGMTISYEIEVQY